MTYGPIDFIALEFKGNQFKGDILASLLELIEQKIVRVIDLVIVVKDENGAVEVRELKQLAPNLVAVFDPLGAEVTEMITDKDAHAVGEALENNSTAAVMLFENLWAIKFKDAVLEANGRLIFQERIPHEVVQEAVAEMAAMSAA
jgi:uncharacterized membrane protein